MKGWAKKTIWFSVWSIFLWTNELIYYLVNRTFFHYNDITALIYLILLLMPLLFLENDK